MSCMISSAPDPAAVSVPTIFYQGEPGAFSEEAAFRFFGKDIHPVGLETFPDVFEAFRHQTSFAVLPLENSTAGPVTAVYDGLLSSGGFIIGETAVSVDQCLAVLPGTELSMLREVFSHEQGLRQCSLFFRRHSFLKPVPSADTAGSARLIAEWQDPTKGAVCSAYAAALYGLQVLCPAIQNLSENHTRFLLLSSEAAVPVLSQKLFLSLVPEYPLNGLSAFADLLADAALELRHLEIRPLPDVPWKQILFLELVGLMPRDKIPEFLQELSRNASDVRLLGAVSK